MKTIYCCFDHTGTKLYEVMLRSSEEDEYHAARSAEERANGYDETIGLYQAKVTDSCWTQLFDYLRDKKYREAASLLRAGSMGIYHIRDFK